MKDSSVSPFRAVCTTPLTVTKSMNIALRDLRPLVFVQSEGGASNRVGKRGMVSIVGEASAAGVHAALEWNKDEMGSAKMQVMLKQALEDWFTFARKGLRGVSVPDLVDSIIMLGLNPDYRQPTYPIPARCGMDTAGQGAFEPPPEDGARMKLFDREFQFRESHTEAETERNS
eukprot:jgi/Undpi1/12132/HiC_scaffold_5.g01808.m1